MNVRAAIGGPLALARAGLRGGSRDALATALVVGVTAFLVTLGPAWFGRATEDVLRERLAGATEAGRGLEYELRGRLEPAAGDPLGAATRIGAELAADLPPTLAAAASEADLLVDGEELLAIGAPRPILRLALRMQDVDDGIRWVAGRPPGPATTVVEVDRPTADGVPPKAIAYEAALSTAAAATVGLGVGDQVLLVPGSNTSGFAVVDVVGLFDVADPAAASWFGDPTLARTVDERVSQEVTIHHAVALVDPGVYPALRGDGGPGSLELPFRYRWRFRLDPARLPTSQPDLLAAELARQQAAHPFGGSAAPALSTGLADLVEGYRSDRAAAGTAVAVAAVGPLAAMLGALGLLVATGQRRRDGALRSVRARGGRTGQAVAGRALEVGAVALPAALAGGALAGLLVESVAPGGLAPAIAVGALVTALAALTAARAAGRPAVGRDAEPGGRAGARPLVLDLLVIAIALGGAAALASREASPDAVADLDPVVAAVPALLALAGGIAVLRLYPAAVGLLARASAGRAGLVVVHAMRGVERGAAGHEVPLLALVLAVATGVFSVLVVGTLDGATGRAAAERVGADVRVEQRTGRSLPAGLDIAGVPGVERTATATRADGRLVGEGRISLPVDLVVLDVPAWLDVVAGLPLGDAVPGSLVAPPLLDAGSPASPVEAVVGAATAERLGLGPGGVGRLTVDGTTVSVRVAATARELAGLGSADEVVLVDRAAADVALPDLGAAPGVVFLRAPATAVAGIAAEVDRFAPDVLLASRDAVLAELRAVPLAEAIRTGFGVALAVALAYAGAIVVLAARRSAGDRRRELAVLRAVGLPARRLAGLLALEVAPLVVAALVAGAAIGAIIAGLVVPQLWLARLVGLEGGAALTGDVPVLVALVAVPVLAAAAAIAAVSRGARRDDLAGATRAVEP